MSQLDGLQAGEQAALLFVEQAVEQQDGGFEFIGGYVERGGVGHQRDRLRGAPGADLIFRASRVGGSVQKTPAISVRRNRP